MLLKVKFKVLLFISIASLFIFSNNFIGAQNLNKIEVTTIEQFQKVAPGESLPINIKLLNMGGTGRVDVELTYKIEDVNKNILTEELETVAVETTANFIKQVKIPPDLKPGRYYLFADLKYPDQKVPAIARLPFQVEYKFFGFFIDQLLILAGAVTAATLLLILLVYFINKSRRIVVSQFNYKDAPPALRPYYELISDIILTMRLHLGDKAIKMANKIKGLKVSEQGEVLEIKKEPLDIVTLLTLLYENNLKYKGLNLSKKAINLRETKAQQIEEKVEYQKTAKLLNHIEKYFVKK